MTCGNTVNTVDTRAPRPDTGGISFTTFDPDRTTYTLIASQALEQTTVTADPMSGNAEVDFDPDDADGTTSMGIR